MGELEVELVLEPEEDMATVRTGLRGVVAGITSSIFIIVPWERLWETGKR